MAHAQAQFALARVLPDGNTERAHLQAVQRATGQAVPELELPPLPAGCEGLWESFKELHNARGSDGMGPNAIGWSDLQAWQQVRRVRLTPWEIDCVLAMDAEAVKAAGAK